MIRNLNSHCQPLLMAAALLSSAAGAHAHGLWIEPGQGGYKVYFGEPEHNLREKGDKLGRFASLKAWKADGSGTRLEIKEDMAGKVEVLATWPGLGCPGNIKPGFGPGFIPIFFRGA